MGIPDFKSEQEEAEWWDSNPDIMLRMFKHAMKHGALRRGTLIKRELEETKEDLK
jgi:hypothetical protein